MNTQTASQAFRTDQEAAQVIAARTPYAAPAAPADFSGREFRNALGMFPTGVAVITSRVPDGKLIGITVNSFTSVSLDPPLVSFNVAKSLGSFDDLMQLDTFVVNLLAESQSGVSSGFARANSDKWACSDSRTGLTGNPVLLPHLAVFECERYAVHEAGDHMIVLGRVVHFEVNEQEAPLVFFRGRYRAMGGMIEEKKA
jgi:3-hydroxy-9,10-secoandrosta-1,3,5(10)-triene-9,17-dione monooxygenase reductase component